MTSMTFNAIDVETANRNRSSICQIGMVEIEKGQMGRCLSILVNPEEPFEYINTSIHGIDENRVRGAETLPGIYPRIQGMLDGAVLLSHSQFDKQAIDKATDKYGIRKPQAKWLDSERIAIAAWPERYGKGGRGLRKIANDLGISFQHHEAGEDARVSAQIFLHACQHTGLGLNDWLKQAGYDQVTPPENTASPPAAPENAARPPAPPPPWAQFLAVILNLEEQKEFNNRAVRGGIDRFMERWDGSIRGELGDSGVHRILLEIRYDGLNPKERPWWIDQWRTVMASPSTN